MRELVKIFKALSDESRLRILKMLEKRPLCVCEITEILGLATSTVSKHLSILRDANFIQDNKDGKWVNYQLSVGKEHVLTEELLPILLEWLGKENKVLGDCQKVERVDRVLICSRDYSPDKDSSNQLEK